MSVLDYVRKAMEIEATAINTLLEQVGGKYEDAIELIRSATGKVVITGVGKSGHVGKKNSSIFIKYRNSSIFLFIVQKGSMVTWV